jgi:hypothetical protein
MDGTQKTKSITVHNYQTNPVMLTPTPSFSGSNAGDFNVTSGTCLTLTPASTLPATSSCTLIVTFAPTAIGAETTTMTVIDSPDPLGPYRVSLAAEATIPESVSPKALHYGNVYQTASKTLNVTVTNNTTQGSITLTGTTIGGANSSDFAVTGGGTCGSYLAASSSCTYAVAFTPSTEASESASLSIGVMEDPNGGPPAIALTGTGLTPLKATPAAGINFGTIAEGDSSVNKTVTVYNYGGAPVSLIDSIGGGPDSVDFAVTGGTCTTLPGGSLAGYSSCIYLLKFTPSIDGVETATFGIAAPGDAASPHNVSLTGTGS